MSINKRMTLRIILLITLMATISIGSQRLRADTGACGGATITLPFTDVPNTNIFFCAIAEAFFTGLTNGTTPTTYAPAAAVTREQMAAFVTRTLDQSLKRGSPRANRHQFHSTTPQYTLGLDLTALPVTALPQSVQSDGKDLWIADSDSGTVLRVRAGDGRLLETWTGAADAFSVLVAMGRVFVAGLSSPNGSLFMLDPAAAAGAVTTVNSSLGENPAGITFDGSRIWTANDDGTVSIVTPGAALPWSGTNVPIAGANLSGILFDGANVWVTDITNNNLRKLNGGGGVIQTVAVGASPANPVFDGTNIWVLSGANAITVVRASTGAVLQTLTGNGLDSPQQVAFDGERVLVTNLLGNSVSLWKAADLTPLGTFPTGPGTLPFGACSDGLNFWITLQVSNALARY